MPSIYHVTLGISLNLSECHSPHLRNQQDETSQVPKGVLMGIRCIISNYQADELLSVNVTYSFLGSREWADMYIMLISLMLDWTRKLQL